MRATVSGVLRRFLPAYLAANPPLGPAKRRAIWAIEHCRTAAMGGEVYACPDCGDMHFAYHSCNHKACPLCGSGERARWVVRQLGKMVGAPYFLVTFTLPQEARDSFFAKDSKPAFDAFFAAASGALAEKLATARGFRAQKSGFIAVLHTWNQRLLFHPHIHFLVPGAGIGADGSVVAVKNERYLVHLPQLEAAFKERYYKETQARDIAFDPAIWHKNFGVDIQPVGSGSEALKYLGAYVARSVISDTRILAAGERTVTFQWKDRDDGGRPKTETIPGEEFVARYLRHVLPRGLRSIRYYGFCHPAAKATLERVQIHTGRPIFLGSAPSSPPPPPRPAPTCPRCRQPMVKLGRLLRVQPTATAAGTAAATRAPPAIAA